MENNMIPSSVPMSRKLRRRQRRDAKILPISDKKKSYKMEFIMECNPDIVGHPALGATGITVIGLEDINGEILSLDRVSPAKWSYIGTMPLPTITDSLVIIPQSKEGQGPDYIYWVGTKPQDFEAPQNSGLNIKAQYEAGNTVNNLSLTLSFKICVISADSKALQEKSQNLQTAFEIVTKENLGALFDLTCKLPADFKKKPDLLKLCGDYFQACFDDTKSLSEFENAIQAYDLAIALLLVNDDRLIEYKCDAGALLLKCYDLTGNMENINLAISMIEIAVKNASDLDGRILAFMKKLSDTLHLCFTKADDLEKLPKAIAMHRKAISLMPEGNWNIPFLLYCLAELLDSQFKRTDNLSNLDEAILVEQKLVNLTPESHENMPSRSYNLGLLLQTRFKRTGDITDIAEAISAQQKAVDLTPKHHPNMPARLYNLGFALQTRFARTGDIADLAEAISAQQKAVDLTPEGHPNMPARLYNLGCSLQTHSERTGDLADIAESISAFQKTMDLTPEGHPSMPMYLNSLGISYQSHFGRTGDLADLTKAISAKQKAVDLTPEGHPSMPIWLGNLGNSFESRFGRTGDIADLAEAISAQQKAVDLTPEGRADMPIRLNSLGNSYESRFERTGDLTDLAEAILAKQKAVDLTPGDFADNPIWLNNLGSSFEARFERTGNIADIAESISAFQKAMDLTPKGHTNMPSILNNLGISFSSRFKRTGDLTDIAEAISAKQKAVDLTPDDHPAMPIWLNNLGSSFQAHFGKTGNPTDLVKAISVHQKAVILTPEGHTNMPSMLYNLGVAFETYFADTKDLSDIHMAISNYHLAATQVTGPPSLCLQAALSWAGLSEEFDKSHVLDAYHTAICLISKVAGLEQTIQTRYNNLIKWSNFSILAAAVAFSLGNLQKALEWLEQGRCLVWSQLTNLRNPLDDLRTYDPILADRFFQLSNALENSGSRIEPINIAIKATMAEKILLQDEAHKHIKNFHNWNQTLATIHRIPKFKNFLQPPSALDLLSDLPTMGFVIIINVHKRHSDALVLVSGDSTLLQIALDNFSYDRAVNLSSHLHSYLLSQNVRMHESGSERRGMRQIKDSNEIYEILQELWVYIVKPILTNLKLLHPSKDLPHIWWCATGPLAFLPLHAAGIYHSSDSTTIQCLSDFAISSYTPTVSTLVQQTKNKHIMDQASTKILLVNPNSPGLPRIPGTKKEVEIIQKMNSGTFDVLCLQNDNASLDQVKKKIVSYNWIHFACHAIQDIKNPLQSGLYLQDGKLELSEIIKIKIPDANFAFLSACQTSTGDEGLSEEAVHLAAGMLAAGYKGVVATMWSIIDDFGPEIAEYFYDILLHDKNFNRKKGLDSSKAAYALHGAIQRFKKRHGNSEDALLGWIPYVHFGL